MLAFGMRVRLAGNWVDTTGVWREQARAETFVDRMNRGGLEAELRRVPGAFETYIDDAVWISKPEQPAVLDAIEAAVLATRQPTA